MLPCRTQATQRPVSDPAMPNHNRPFAGQPHLHLPGVARQATPGDAGCHQRGANRRRSTSTAAPRQRRDRAGGAAGDADAEDAAGLIADAAVSPALEVVSSARGGRAGAGAGQPGGAAAAASRGVVEAVSKTTAVLTDLAGVVVQTPLIRLAPDRLAVTAEGTPAAGSEAGNRPAARVAASIGLLRD